MLDMNTPIPEELALADKEPAALADVLPMLDIAASNRFVTLDDPAQINIYLAYMTYRVQRVMYKFCKGSGKAENLSWERFVLFVRQLSFAQTVAKMVVRETVKNFCFCENFNFDVDEVTFIDDSDEETGKDDVLHCSALFSRDEGFALVEYLLLHAELAQYKRQLDQGKHYSWTEFLDELLLKGPLWHQVMMAFSDALVRSDYNPAWENVDLVEALKQSGEQEA